MENAYSLMTTGTQAIVNAGGFSTDLFSRFLSYVDVKPKSLATYTRSLRQFAIWLSDNAVTAPRREDILRFRDHLKAGYSAATVHLYITAIRLFFSWTEQEGIYPNVANHVKAATISKEHKKDALTSSQAKAILGDIERDSLQGKRDYAMFALMVVCGLRDVEVHRANVEDLRQRGNQTVLYVQGKGREDRTEFVVVPAEVERAVREYLKARGNMEPKAPLFCSLSNNSKGDRVSTRSISGTIKGRLKASGYDSDRLTAHSLRHTAVTLSLIGGATVQEAKEFARHANIATTLIYAHNLEAEQNSCSRTVAKALF